MSWKMRNVETLRDSRISALSIAACGCAVKDATKRRVYCGKICMRKVRHLRLARPQTGNLANSSSNASSSNSSQSSSISLPASPPPPPPR